MGVLAGFVPAGGASAFRGALAGLTGLFVLSSMGPAGAADVAPEPDSSAYTYLTLEGGYVNLDGEDVQGYLHRPQGEEWGERLIDLSDGVYGRAEFGRVWNTGVFNGIGAYVQGWDGDDEDVSEIDVEFTLPYQHNDVFERRAIGDFNGAQGEASLDRSLVEAGLRLFHQYDYDASGGGFSLGSSRSSPSSTRIRIPRLDS